MVALAGQIGRGSGGSSKSLLREFAAAAMKPRAKVRPSEWVRANVSLPAEVTMRPGPFDPDYLPWTRAVLDAVHNEPGKSGVIGIKRSQVGWSFATLALMLCWADTSPGPMLYITDSNEKAKEFSSQLWGWIERNPRLLAAFERAEKERRSVEMERPFVGGKITFGGSGSESTTTSTGRCMVVLDEYEMGAERYRQNVKGSLWTSAEARVQQFRSISALMAFAHPRKWDSGIGELYTRVSDERCWVFDCPHCAQPVFLEWKLVRPREDGTPALCCHSCGGEIEDSYRRRAVWPAHLGGSGRFLSRLPREEAAKRPYIGLWVHGLASPQDSVAALWRGWVNCKTEEDRSEYHCKVLGEPYEPAVSLVTVENVRECVRQTETITVPGGDLGARYLVVGADVQAPRDNPTILASAVAYAASGMAYLVALRACRGFADYHTFLRTVGVRVEGDPSPRAAAVNGVLWCRAHGIDAKYEGGQVLDSCRTSLYAAPGGGTGGRIEHVPVSFQSHLNADNPVTLAPERKRMHPTRPELGLLEHYYWAWRHAWMDRAIRRIQDKRLVVLCPVSAEWYEHVTSNVLRPVKRMHGLDPDRFEWTKPNQFRDDWLTCLAYAELAAAKVLGLDRLHLETGGGSVAGGGAARKTERSDAEAAWNAESGYGGW